MIDFGVRNLAFISIPEEFLLLIITLLLLGYKEKLKGKLNIIKICLVTIVTALITTVFQSLGLDQNIRLILQLILFSFTYALVFRVKWYEALTGHFLTAIGYSILEAIGLVIIIAITGISYDTLISQDSNTWTMVLFSLPGRALQFLFALLLYRLPFTLVQFERIRDFSKKTIQKITSLSICLFLAFLLIPGSLTYYINHSGDSLGLSDLLSLIFVCIVSILLFSILLYHSIKETNSINKKQKERLKITSLSICLFLSFLLIPGSLTYYINHASDSLGFSDLLPLIFVCSVSILLFSILLYHSIKETNSINKEQKERLNDINYIHSSIEKIIEASNGNMIQLKREVNELFTEFDRGC